MRNPVLSLDDKEIIEITESFQVAFALKIRAFCKEMGISLRLLHKAAGISKNLLNDIEHNRRNLTAADVWRYFRIVQAYYLVIFHKTISVYDFFSGMILDNTDTDIKDLECYELLQYLSKITGDDPKKIKHLIAYQLFLDAQREETNKDNT